MISAIQAANDITWLRDHVKQNRISLIDLQPKLQNVRYSTLARWMSKGNDTVPRKRSDLRSIAAYRARVLKRNLAIGKAIHDSVAI